MTKGIFVTATGTDVGKTYISALLVKKLRQENINCGYYKPVLSGAEVIDGELVQGDCEYVKNIAELPEKPLELLSYAFTHPLSPHLAAKIEDNPIKLNKIKFDFNKIKQKYDYILVEGAGGIVCPMDLSDKKLFLIEDIIKGLGLSVIVVASAALGSINSAVTTVEYAKNHGIKVNGIILNHFDKSDIMQQDNKLQIEKLTKVQVIATVADNTPNIEIELSMLLNTFEEI